MALKRCFSICVLIALVGFLRSTNCSLTTNKKEIIKKIVNTLNNISDKNDQLKKLIEAFISNASEDAKSIDDCQCVPFYLCNNGNIIKDGSRLLQSRTGVNPCTNVGEICCEAYFINSTTASTPKRKIAIEDCGYPSEIQNVSSPLDATVSKFGEFPWTVMILNSNFIYQCVGSLIHPQVVLTTSHCVQNETVFTVRAGEWNTTTTKEPFGHENRKVKSVIKHPRFGKDNLHYNAALLLLDMPFKLNVNIKTICLADEFGYQTQNDYKTCTATGWGTDRLKGTYRRIMKKIDFSLMPHTECQSKFKTSRLGRWYKLHRSFVCGKNEEKRDLCTGDGGGPLVCPIEMKPLRFQQTGITSWGLTCDGDFPSVFTDVSYIKNWIDAQFYALKLNTKYYTA